MGDEIVKLVCLVPCENMEINVVLEEVYSVIRDALEVIFNIAWVLFACTSADVARQDYEKREYFNTRFFSDY